MKTVRKRSYYTDLIIARECLKIVEEKKRRPRIVVASLFLGFRIVVVQKEDCSCLVDTNGGHLFRDPGIIRKGPKPENCPFWTESWAEGERGLRRLRSPALLSEALRRYYY